MGRSNKRISRAPARQQMAFHEPSSTTTRLTLLEEGSKWSWTIDHGGQTYTSGIRPASGPAVFNELSQCQRGDGPAARQQRGAIDSDTAVAGLNGRMWPPHFGRNWRRPPWPS